MSINAPDPSYGEGYAPFNGPPGDASLHQGLLSHWQASLGNSGDEIVDATGNRHDGVNDGADWVSSDRGPMLNYVFANTDYVTVAKSPVFTDPNVMSIAAWVKVSQAWIDNGSRPRQTVFSSGSNNGASFQLEIEQIARISIVISGYFVAQTRDFTFPDPTEWVHIVYARNGTGDGIANHFWYVQGIPRTDNNESPDQAYSQSTNDALIGARTTSSQHCDGLIDSITIWDRVITPNEVRTLYGDWNAIPRLAPMPAPVTGAAAPVSDIDTREKRASVPGVARPYARGKLPTTIDAAWRQATGLTYAGSTIAAPAGGFVPAYAVNANTLLGGGTA